MKLYTPLLWLLPLALSLQLTAADSPPKAPANPTPWTAQEIRLVDKPNEIVTRLQNGMVAIVKEDHTTPVAAVRLYVRAGSIYEDTHLGAGLSHMFEHLLVGGETSRRTEQQSADLIQQIGARYNAYTTTDHTCYFLTAPAQHVGTALNLIADWVTRPTFPQAAFDREWGVVQRELEMNASDPQRQGYYLFNELRYRVHPARYPIIGYQAVVQQVTRQTILDYYQQMYVPENCVVAIAGDINAAQMLDAIRREFADFAPRPKRMITLPKEPPVMAPRDSVKVMPSMQGPAQLKVGFPSIKLQHDDLYALDVVAAILGQGQSSRLYRQLRQEQQLVVNIGAYNATPSYADGTFVIHGQLLPENIPAARQAVWNEIRKLQKKGVDQNELSRVKKQLQVDHVRQQQTAEQQAAALARDFISTGDPHFSKHYVEKMQAVNADQVQAAAQRYLQPDRQITLALTPTPLPQPPAKAANNTGESEIKKITLDNGLRVLLKRNDAVPLVTIQLYLKGGLLVEPDQNSGLANLMAKLSTKGTRHYNAQQIIDYFETVGGQFDAISGNNTFVYSAEVLADDFPKSLEILAEIVQQPTFPQDELDKLKQEVAAALDQVENSWSAQARRYFRSQFFRKSPYQNITLGKPDNIKAITTEQITQLHKQAIAASRTVLAIFGDIDLPAAEAAARERFCQMPKGQTLTLTQPQPWPPADQPRLVVMKTDKPGASIYIGFPGINLTNIQDRYALEVVSEIIGSSTSTGWLFETLRGQRLVYSTWMDNFMGLLPGYIAATAQCEPEKAPEVQALMTELLKQAAQGRFTPEQVQRAKSKRINAEILRKQTIADAAADAALDELYGFGFDWSKDYADRVMAVNLDKVRQVAKQYLGSVPTTTIITSKPELFKKTDQK